MSILITGSSSYIGTEFCEHPQTAPSIDEMISTEVLPPRETFETLIFFERYGCGDLDVSIFSDDGAESEMEVITEIISGIRNIRGEMGLSPTLSFDVTVQTNDEAKAQAIEEPMAGAAIQI